MIILECWSSPWFAGRYDPCTGRLRRRLQLSARDPLAPPAGWFAVEVSLDGCRLPVVLFSSGAHLSLRIGSIGWRLPDPTLTFVHSSLPGTKASVFTVRRNGSPVFTLSYRHRLRSYFAAIDPAYDALDYEHDHFLAFIASTVADTKWQASALRQWLPQGPQA